MEVILLDLKPSQSCYQNPFVSKSRFQIQALPVASLIQSLGSNKSEMCALPKLYYEYE